jgi:hypothetical protein
LSLAVKAMRLLALRSPLQAVERWLPDGELTGAAVLEMAPDRLRPSKGGT